MTRWLAWIHLFDFDVRHVSGKNQTAADGLSRRPPTLQDEEGEEEENIDDFIAAQLAFANVAPLRVYPSPLRTAWVLPFGFDQDPETTAGGDEEEQGEPQTGEWEDPHGPLRPGYSEFSQRIAAFLTTETSSQEPLAGSQERWCHLEREVHSSFSLP